jgi:nitroreductase
MLTRRRTVRKFDKKHVSKDLLEKCVDAARLSPSGMNRQPLKYIIVDDECLLSGVFSTTSWAGYLPDYGPNEEEMPRAYVVILLDTGIRENCGHDAGIGAMSISMVAFEAGVASCILGAIDRPKLRKILNIPSHLEIVLAVALGFPAEHPVIDQVKGKNIRYWLDANGVLHVPKRELEDVVQWNSCQFDPE